MSVDLTRKCSICGTVFTPVHPNTRQQYCSEECRAAAKRQQSREYSARKRDKRRKHTGLTIFINKSNCKHRSTCIYRSGSIRQGNDTCDYSLIKHELRGCPASDCTRYIPRAGVTV